MMKGKNTLEPIIDRMDGFGTNTNRYCIGCHLTVPMYWDRHLNESRTDLRQTDDMLILPRYKERKEIFEVQP